MSHHHRDEYAITHNRLDSPSFKIRFYFLDGRHLDWFFLLVYYLNHRFFIFTFCTTFCVLGKLCLSENMIFNIFFLLDQLEKSWPWVPKMAACTSLEYLGMVFHIRRVTRSAARSHWCSSTGVLIVAFSKPLLKTTISCSVSLICYTFLIDSWRQSVHIYTYTSFRLTPFYYHRTDFFFTKMLSCQ